MSKIFGRNNDNSKEARHSPVSTILALFLCVAFTGQAYRATLPYVLDYMGQQYGDFVSWGTTYLWFPLVGLCIFVVARSCLTFALRVLHTFSAAVGFRFLR